MDFPDDLFRRLKALAAMRGVSIKQILQKAIEDELVAAEANSFARTHVRLPLVKSKHPGSLHLTNGNIEDLLA